MLLFPAFCALTWFLCFRYRRQWKGLVVTVAALVAVLTIALLDRKLHEWGGAANPGWSNFQFLLYVEAAAILAPGLFLWGMPRVSAKHPCRKCGYELAGLGDVLDHAPASGPKCPECGTAFVPDLAMNSIGNGMAIGAVAGDRRSPQAISVANATGRTPPPSAG